MLKDEDNDVIVVSIDEYSLSRLINDLFYSFPKGTRKVKKFFAFYESGKITYYAQVDTVKEVGKSELDLEYWAYCFPDKEPPYQMVTFKKINKLEFPININKNLPRGKGHIQGRIYTSIKKLKSAKFISDLK
jgi:hypothetical protein